MPRQERQERNERFDKREKREPRRSFTPRKPAAKFQLPKEAVIDYKDITLLQKYVSDRGKMLSRRISGISAKDQRQISRSIKIARYLGLLTVLGAH